MIFRPPPKDGIGASTVYLPQGKWPTLYDFLVERFPAVPKSEWEARFNERLILSENGIPIEITAPYASDSQVFYYRRVKDEPRIPFEEKILFADDYLVVVDKPHFLPVISTGRYVQESLLVRLKRTLGMDSIAPLHRIDRETAGLVLFAVRPETRGRYMEMFRRHTITKRYEAIAPLKSDLPLPLELHNRLEESEAFMQMHIVEGKPNSKTTIELIESQGKIGRYSLSPITGKRHQLRVHMAHLGIPILNDRLYPLLLPAAKTELEREAEYKKPLQLLAKNIEFVDPFTRATRRFQSALRLDWPSTG